MKREVVRSRYLLHSLVSRSHAFRQVTTYLNTVTDLFQSDLTAASLRFPALAFLHPCLIKRNGKEFDLAQVRCLDPLPVCVAGLGIKVPRLWLFRKFFFQDNDPRDKHIEGFEDLCCGLPSAEEIVLNQFLFKLAVDGVLGF